MQRLFSGARPTGQLHIGNYLGAIKNWVDLVSKYDSIFAAVDYHAITSQHDPKQIKEGVRNLVLDYLSVGLDPEKCHMVVQSMIPEHTELAWILNTITPLSELQRMPTFKEKIQTQPKDVNMALLDYPVLMAADILIYKSVIVPVGEDQAPHVEFTRSLARKFNNQFGKTFIEPKEYIMKTGAKIMSLKRPNEKMSKTAGDGILLSDKPEAIKKKVMSATTDSGKEIKAGKDKPGITNLLSIYSLFTNKTIEESEKDFEGKSYADFKSGVADAIIAGLRPIQDLRAKYEKDKGALDRVLEDGVAYARPIAQQTINEVKEKVGLWTN